MPTWNGIVSTSTMRDTKNWACHWGLGWSRVPVNGSSNNASKGLGCGGVRTGSTTLCTSGSPGSMDALRPCSVWPCPPTRNCARAKMLNHIQRKQRAYVGDLKLNRKVVYMGREQKLQDVARQIPWEAKNPCGWGVRGIGTSANRCAFPTWRTLYGSCCFGVSEETRRRAKR